MTPRIRILEIEGEPEELAKLDIEKLLGHGSTGRESNGKSESPEGAQPQIPEELRRYVNGNAARPESALFQSFLAEVLGWNGVTWRFGADGRSGKPRYVLVHRVPQHKGAFVYVSPRQRRLTFRLLAKEVEASPLSANLRGRVYQVVVALSSEAALDKAIELARMAYERAAVDS